MILAFDTSTAACTAALFDGAGECLAHADEVIGRGHAERLVPMLDELLDGRKAERIIVGVGPGSFTGMRVGIAAAQGLAIGWGAELSGMMSLALIAASADYDDSVAVAVMRSRMVICGDPNQVDLPDPTKSGLADAVARLKGIKSISVIRFTAADVVRHPLVGKIVEAYEGPDA